MFVVTIGCQEQVTELWGAVVQARLSQAVDVLETRAASLLLHLSALQDMLAGHCCALSSTCHKCSCPVIRGEGGIHDAGNDLAPSVLRGNLCQTLCQQLHLGVVNIRGSGALLISLYLLSLYYPCNGPHVVPSPVVHLPSLISGCVADFLPTWVGSYV